MDLDMPDPILTSLDLRNQQKQPKNKEKLKVTFPRKVVVEVRPLIQIKRTKQTDDDDEDDTDHDHKEVPSSAGEDSGKANLKLS